MSKYLVVTYTQFAAEMPVAIFRAESLEEARGFILEFEKQDLPLATEIVLDRTEGEFNDQHSAA